MNKVRITAIRQTVYEDLMAKFENPIEHTCDVGEGQQWISVDGECPDGMSVQTPLLSPPRGEDAIRMEFLPLGGRIGGGLDEEPDECHDQL